MKIDRYKRHRIHSIKSVIFLLLVGLITIAKAQGTAFTYQGKLSDSGSPASGSFDMQIKLFDTVTIGTGTQQGGTFTATSVQVANGLFAVTIDFGPEIFDGSARYLEISVKQTSSPTFVTLG